MSGFAAQSPRISLNELNGDENRLSAIDPELPNAKCESGHGSGRGNSFTWRIMAVRFVVGEGIFLALALRNRTARPSDGYGE